MPAVFNQTATAAGAGKIAACSGATPIGTQGQNCLCTIGGSAGGAVTVGGTQMDIGTNEAAVYMEIDPAAGVLWKAGNYVVRINVTTLNTLVTWTGTYICRLNSSNVSQATIGSLTGQTTSMGTTGVKTHTVSGAAQTPSAGDKIYIVCVFSVVTSNNQSFGWTKDQAVDTPLVIPIALAPSADAWANLADSVAMIRQGPWRDSVAITLGTVSGATPKTFSGTDSINLWADSTKGFVKFFAGLSDPALNLTDSIKGFRPERAGLTDAWNNLSDSGATLRKGYLKPSLSDAWNNLNDSLATLRKGLYKISATDDWSNLADSLATLRKGYLKPQLSDAWGNLNDSTAAFLRFKAALNDTLNFWSDLVAKTLTTGTIPKTFSGTDNWQNLNDSLNAFFKLRAALSDSALNFNDSLAAREKFLAGYIEALNLWNDLVAKTLTTGLTPISKSMTDVWATEADSLMAFERFRVALSDGMSMNDALGIALTGGAPALGSQHRRKWRRTSA